jgi:hypothetical protein
MVESIEKIKEKDPLSSWLMESSIKYMDRPLKVLKAAAPKHIIKEVKCCFDCVLHGEQVAELLGHQMMGGHHIQVGDRWVSYFLRTPPFLLIGLDMYTLDIWFDDDGSFQEARVVFSD